jgi:hypothetical protein
MEPLITRPVVVVELRTTAYTGGESPEGNQPTRGINWLQNAAGTVRKMLRHASVHSRTGSSTAVSRTPATDERR